MTVSLPAGKFSLGEQFLSDIIVKIAGETSRTMGGVIMLAGEQSGAFEVPGGWKNFSTRHNLSDKFGPCIPPRKVS
jgi:hypothetical protein